MPLPFVHLAPGALSGAGPGDRIDVAPDDRHHLERVLRLGPGDHLVVADGEGRSAPARLDGPAVVLDAVPEVEPAPEPRIEVVHGLPKGRKLDDVVRVLTELGVDRVVPVATERSVVELRGHRAQRAAERWRSVARAAASQSRRARLPDIAVPTRLEESLPAAVTGIVAHPRAGTGLRPVLQGLPPTPRLSLAVGPEGGWTDQELGFLEGHGLARANLGRAVLRTEHAAAALLAAVAFHIGRMD